MRLFDILRRDDPTWPSRAEMPIVVADDIAAAIDQLPNDTPHPTAVSYGCVAPPFNLFFVEARTCLDGVEVLRGVGIRATRGDEIGRVFVNDVDEVYWQLAISGYVWTRAWNYIRGYPGMAFLHLNADGYLLDDMARVTITQVPNLPRGNYLPLRGLANHIVYAMTAVSHMHQRCPVEHVTPSRQMRRQAERKSQMRLHDYYYLKVRPQTKRYESASAGRPFTKQEHVVRGHFRYYGEERPLFGRVSGMVWIPEHKRGDSGAGSVDKGYEVNE